MKRLFAYHMAAFAAFVFLTVSVFAAPVEDLPRYALLQDEPAVSESELSAPPRSSPTVLALPDGAPAAVPGIDIYSPINQLLTAIALAIGGYIVVIVKPLLDKLGGWLGNTSKIHDITADLQMDKLAGVVAQQALDWSIGQIPGLKFEDLKDVRIRSSVLHAAATFVRDQWPEIWAWVDKDKNGQVDYLESRLSLPPVVMPTPTPAP